jgi:hypothetical protein
MWVSMSPPRTTIMGVSGEHGVLRPKHKHDGENWKWARWTKEWVGEWDDENERAFTSMNMETYEHLISWRFCSVACIDQSDAVSWGSLSSSSQLKTLPRRDCRLVDWVDLSASSFHSGLRVGILVVRVKIKLWNEFEHGEEGIEGESITGLLTGRGRVFYTIGKKRSLTMCIFAIGCNITWQWGIYAVLLLKFTESLLLEIVSSSLS